MNADEAARAAMEWEAERNAACLSIARARADSADEREAEKREAERDRTHTDPDLQAFLAAKTGRVALSPLEAMLKHQAEAPPERDGPGRDFAATYGGLGRPAVLVSTADGALLDMGARQVHRSASQAADDALLARARSMRDTFMEIEIHRFDQRRGGAGRAGDAAVSRASGFPVISR